MKNENEFISNTSNEFSVNININNFGTNNDTINSITNSKKDSISYDENDKCNIDNSINIFRFKFTNEFINELFKFSKVHQYDNRIDFKKSWNDWIDENENIISLETRRLLNLGYKGNIVEKMYKSARYYFRKKPVEKKKPIDRRSYISINKELIDSIDEFIESSLNEKESSIKPSETFDNFCNKNNDLLKETINYLGKNGLNNEDIKNKIKKTYKNRYFLIKSK
jgi:hypothetical protein